MGRSSISERPNHTLKDWLGHEDGLTGTWV
jgi:hypothetical protein